MFYNNVTKDYWSFWYSIWSQLQPADSCWLTKVNSVLILSWLITSAVVLIPSSCGGPFYFKLLMPYTLGPQGKIRNISSCIFLAYCKHLQSMLHIGQNLSISIQLCAYDICNTVFWNSPCDETATPLTQMESSTPMSWFKSLSTWAWTC